MDMRLLGRIMHPNGAAGPTVSCTRGLQGHKCRENAGGSGCRVAVGLDDDVARGRADARVQLNRDGRATLYTQADTRSSSDVKVTARPPKRLV